jgi:adenylate cyclase
MAETRVERRLAAILTADVIGYSRLMGVDEEGTLAALKICRRELIDPKIAEHRGRIVKSTGDGLLVEFGSAVHAMRCAMEIQQMMTERNANTPEDRRVEFRIGINVGDIIIDEGDIYGDGVNIAARIEALASPGAICLSDNAYQQIKGKLAFDVIDMGEQHLKNIAQPVRVYGVRLDGASERPALALPDKPSIAVLPFQNMSGDPQQDYFADGMVEDIITGLSRIKWLFVIARNSTFTYRGRAVDVKQVGRELGVRYVLEGSVRKSRKRIRITVQLVDTLTGAHHWAERFDRDLTDIFTLQDEIAQQVVGAIEPRLLTAEGIRSQSRAPGDLDAWDIVARAMNRYWRLTRADVEAANAMLKEAVAKHPEYAPAHSMLAFTLVLAGHLWHQAFEVPKLAIDSARRGAELDDSDPWAHLALGYVAFVRRQTDEAVAQFNRAIELNPNFAAAHGYLGYPLAFDGQSEKAIASLLLAIRLSPHDRQNPIFMAGIAVAHYCARRYDHAIEWARKAVRQGPSVMGIQRVLIASLAQSGQIDEARVALAHIREAQPEISLAWAEKMVPYTPAQMPHFLGGLKMAGLQ